MVKISKERTQCLVAVDRSHSVVNRRGSVLWRQDLCIDHQATYHRKDKLFRGLFLERVQDRPTLTALSMGFCLDSYRPTLQSNIPSVFPFRRLNAICSKLTPEITHPSCNHTAERVRRSPPSQGLPSLTTTSRSRQRCRPPSPEQEPHHRRRRLPMTRRGRAPPQRPAPPGGQPQQQPGQRRP
jgi:hypothetical protein